MTLCVAAVTGWNDGGSRARIVMASDRCVESTIAGVEIQTQAGGIYEGLRGDLGEEA